MTVLSSPSEFEMIRWRASCESMMIDSIVQTQRRLNMLKCSTSRHKLTARWLNIFTHDWRLSQEGMSMLRKLFSAWRTSLRIQIDDWRLRSSWRSLECLILRILTRFSQSFYDCQTQQRCLQISERKKFMTSFMTHFEFKWKFMLLMRICCLMFTARRLNSSQEVWLKQMREQESERISRNCRESSQPLNLKER